jgi:hypothetical protein
MASIIQLRGGLAATWTTSNPILAQKEMGIETDTNKIKLGDGTTAWTSLAYFETGEVTLSSSQVFTNKTITFADNTLTGVVPTSAIGVTVQAYDATIVVDADIGVTVQAADADTTKNDVSNTFTAVQTFGASVVETKVAMAAAEIDLATGNYFTKTVSGNITLTVANTAASGSVSAFVLELTNGGSAAVTFFSGVTWAAATPPTLTAAGVDTLAFFTSDGGTTWRAFVLGLGMA